VYWRKRYANPFRIQTTWAVQTGDIGNTILPWKRYMVAVGAGPRACPRKGGHGGRPYNCVCSRNNAGPYNTCSETWVTPEWYRFSSEEGEGERCHGARWTPCRCGVSS